MASIPFRPSPFTLALVVSVPLLVAAGSARADGAIAVGLPEEGAQEGFAYGFASGYRADEAERRALEQCRRSRGSASRDVRDLCRVVETFSSGCVAVAMDPKDGTPGVGWGLGPDRRTAEREAISACHATAGEGRRLSCKVDAWACEKP